MKIDFNSCSRTIPLNSLLILTLLLLTSPMPSAKVEAETKDFKVATVDINKVLNELKEAQKKKQELDTISKEAKKKIESKQASLKKMQGDLQKKNVAADSEEAEELRQAIKDFERYVSDAEEDLKRRFLQVNRDLTEKVVKAIETYAKRNKIDLVLDKNTTGRSPVLFGDPSTDITNAVLRDMNG